MPLPDTARRSRHAHTTHQAALPPRGRRTDPVRAGGTQAPHARAGRRDHRQPGRAHQGHPIQQRRKPRAGRAHGHLQRVRPDQRRHRRRDAVHRRLLRRHSPQPHHRCLQCQLRPRQLRRRSPFIEDVAYAAYRLALQNGADADDTIQNDIPSGDSFPARRSFGGSVSQESTLTLTTANLKALGLRPNDGSVDAELFIGTLPDGDPTDGIGNGLSGDFFGDFSLADILVHEVGHALGFINVIEFGLENPTSLDVHRFQRTGPDNPDTAAEFTNFPRALWTNQGPQSDRLHAFNFIDREHLASNAFDFQASHFEETGAFPDRIGIMEPAIAPFETGFPEYFSQADIDAFDAIGWDIVTESQCNAADLAPPFFTLDLADISAFVSGFTSADPVADLAAPFGTLDLADISVFVTAFSAGCP